MRLADFIVENREQILAEWEAFARTLLPAADGLDATALRDHASQILQAVVLDLGTEQTAEEELAKSQGRAPRAPHSAETAAETHAVLRAASGFSMQQLVAEYRALRASVLRLWATVPPGPDTLADMVRFNEAVDQAVAESVDFFMIESERWRNVFLGVLGHDLRGPLNSVLLTARLIAKLSDGTPASAATVRLIKGGERMRQLLDDLLDYSRASLKLGIPVSTAPMDLAVACEEEIELQRAAWPGRTIELAVEGVTTGTWDASRLKQVLGNLITNAAKYGDDAAPIRIGLIGTDAEVSLSVENSGPGFEAGTIEAMFEPLRRGAGASPENARTSLGLGLFIVRQIVRAHGGSVTASSSGRRTVFTVTLPRTVAP